MLSITGAIFTTVGILVMLGWELNILESVTISIAVGLSIDFTLHYAMAYRLSPHLDREMRVVTSISRMGSPVGMAALTTFLVGAIMLPSTVLAYRKLGIFLMIVMSVSWAFATFFFQALLRTLGHLVDLASSHGPVLIVWTENETMSTKQSTLCRNQPCRVSVTMGEAQLRCMSWSHWRWWNVRIICTRIAMLIIVTTRDHDTSTV